MYSAYKRNTCMFENDNVTGDAEINCLAQASSHNWNLNIYRYNWSILELLISLWWFYCFSSSSSSSSSKQRLVVVVRIDCGDQNVTRWGH